MPLILGANSASGGYEIDNSLRFNSGSSDNLSRTPASASNRKTFTWSGWVKLSKSSFNDFLEVVGPTSPDTRTSFMITDQDKLNFFTGNTFESNIVTTQVFRDFSAWYHIVLAVDTTQATASNRVKMYVNGNQITDFSTADYPSQNLDTQINNNQLHTIGKVYDPFFANMYLTEVNFIDGTQLTPSSFGQTDSATGIWTPLPFTGTYGTNGFYLKFGNSAALGTDSSGNGNTWTVNNLTSVDQSTDTPTNNFCTFNPLDFGNNATSYATFSEGNLKAVGNTSAWRGAHGTMGVSKGKWYYEGKAIGIPDGDTGVYIGWCDPALATTYDVAGNNADYNFYIWTNQAIRFNNSITTSYYSFTQDDICGFALDLDNGKGYISKNGTFYNNGNTSSTPDTGSPDFTITLPPTNNGVLVPCILAYNDGGFFLNFGSPPYAANAYADADGFGNFSYAVPAGYYSLCTKNLAEYA
jgi:hypothetical protein